MTPPYLQFFDSNGDPLAGGKVYTYTATGTFSTLKATFTTEEGDVEHPNPVILDAAGRPATGNGSIWLSGTYDFLVTDSDDVEIESTLNVTAFTTTGEASTAYFESFSGTGSQTAFTTSEDLGTDERAIYVWVDSGLQENVTNGDFDTDTDWTKGTGWTIGSGVATATGAISTAIEQNSAVTLIEGQAYTVTYTMTRSAGGLIPSVGGTDGTEQTADGTYTEVIIAGSTQVLAWTGNGFTGTLDSVSVTPAVSAGYNFQDPSNYTIDGTTLTFATAPAAGTNNIYVSSPSTLVNAASAAAADAEASAAAALASESTASAAASTAAQLSNKWNFDSSTTIADPGTADIILNNATLSSVTQIAISANSANSGNPDLSDYIATWDNNDNASGRGTIQLLKSEANENFALYAINGDITDNTTWLQIPVTHIASSGSFADTDELFLGFARSGTDGTGTGTVTSITAGTGLSGGTITSSGTIALDSGWVLLSTQDASNSTSIDFTSDIDGTYDRYVVTMENVVPATNNVDLRMLVSTDGGSSYLSSNYGYTGGGTKGSSSAFGGTASNSAAFIILTFGGNIGNATGENLSGVITISNPSETSLYKLIRIQTTYYDQEADFVWDAGVGGNFNDTSAIDAFRFLASSGNIASGTFKLYGVL